MKTIFAAWREYMARGCDVVLCSVVASSGSAPRGTGAKMLVLADGTIAGTIGGGAVEQAAIARALLVHKDHLSGSRCFDLSAANRSDLGMVCGGSAEVYFQFASAQDESIKELLALEQELRARGVEAWLISRLDQNLGLEIGICAAGRWQGTFPLDIQAVQASLGALARRLRLEGRDSEAPTSVLYIEPLVQSGKVYIFGGGHVSQALVPVIAKVGFVPVVFEDRERFANKELFPGVAETIVGNFNNICEHVHLTEQDCSVIMTRGHEADYAVLRQVLSTPVYYLGLIGSRHKLAHTQERLLQEGFTQQALQRIHNPIGLPIMADTPEEIAISVAAEMILHRAQHLRKLHK